MVIQKLDPKLKAVLCKALTEIEKRGWIKGAENTNDGVCTIGALRVATRSDSVLEACAAAMGFEDPEDQIPDWNDSDHRRKSHVVRRFCKAINNPSQKRIKAANELLHRNPLFS